MTAESTYVTLWGIKDLNNNNDDKDFHICMVCTNTIDEKSASEVFSYFINKNTSIFIFAGKYAEKIHDLIDDLFLSIQQCDPKKEIITTWHESLSDAVDFLLLQVELTNGNSVVILDKTDSFDRQAELLIRQREFAAKK